MTRLTTTFALLLAGLALNLPNHSQAQYMGPHAYSDTPTVQDILDDPVDGRPARIKGKLLQKINYERYVFSDGTATIIVEIEDDLFAHRPVDENTLVEISGEVDTGLRRPPEIDVETLRVLIDP